MEIEGKIWQEGKMCLVEIPSLDAMTQGKSKKNALLMARSLIEEMTVSYFKEGISKKFQVTVTDCGENAIAITASDTIPNVIEKLAFDKEAAQICASERATIVQAQGASSEAQICCEADAVKNQFFNCVRYKLLLALSLRRQREKN